MTIEDKFNEFFSKDFFEKLKEEKDQSNKREIFALKTKELFNIEIFEMITHLSNSTIENANKIAEEFSYIAPYEDYGNLLEDLDDKSEFIANDASKVENWLFSRIKMAEHDLLEFEFNNLAIEYLIGSVFINESGKIKHSFAYNGD